MRTASAGATDPGRKRANNEDAFLVLEDARLFAVADGVGGREGGEIASALAVDTLREAVPDLLGSSDRTPPAGVADPGEREPAALRTAVSLANRSIIEAVQQRPELSGMGTTITALLLARSGAHLVHAGDSRAYRLRSGKLRQLSDDHSVVAEQVKAGVMTRAQARRSAHRHVITRALGIHEEVAPDLWKESVQPGDVYLLCSDGLTEMVEDKEIAGILKCTEPAAAVAQLIAAANKAGGADNITAVVVKVLEV
jgi:serine/threonine protein phosphatase PrpC